MSKSVGKGQKLERDKEGASLRAYIKKEDGPTNTWILETRDNTFCFLSHSICGTLLRQLEENTVGYCYYVAIRLLEDKKDFMPFDILFGFLEPFGSLERRQSGLQNHGRFYEFILFMTSWKQNHELSPASFTRWILTEAYIRHTHNQALCSFLNAS